MKTQVLTLFVALAALVFSCKTDVTTTEAYKSLTALQETFKTDGEGVVKSLTDLKGEFAGLLPDATTLPAGADTLFNASKAGFEAWGQKADAASAAGTAVMTKLGDLVTNFASGKVAADAVTTETAAIQAEFDAFKATGETLKGEYAQLKGQVEAVKTRVAEMVAKTPAKGKK